MVQERARLVIKTLAFTLIGGRTGTGGYTYLLNLMRAIDSFAVTRLRSKVFVGVDVAEEEIAPFRAIASVEIVRSGVFDATQGRKRLAQAVLLGQDNEAAQCFRRHLIDVVFEPAMFFGWRFPMPVLAWLPDFQHQHLRHLFSTRAFWRRELGFRAQIASDRIIMLSSEDARADCERFYTAARGRTAVVRFAVPVDPVALSQDPAEVARQYDLPARFFYLPNQFWKHKNHTLVIDALHLLKQRGCEIVVAATGKADDPRHPHHYEELKALVASRGLQSNFRFLGLVPRSHVIALMRACTALINPSRFEGWSTPVEEAKTLGVPMLLSNLPVHREQVGESAGLFDLDSAPQVAALLEAHPGVSIEVRRERERLAVQASIKRVNQFAADFTAAVDRVSRSFPS